MKGGARISRQEKASASSGRGAVLFEEQVGDEESAQREEEGDRRLAAEEESAIGRVGQPGAPLVIGVGTATQIGIATHPDGGICNSDGRRKQNQSGGDDARNARQPNASLQHVFDQSSVDASTSHLPPSN
jgi:hypothetical protein